MTKVFLATSHGIPKTGALPPSVKHVRRHLCSFFYDVAGGKPSHTITTLADLGIDLFLDCGAFSAQTQGKEIDLAAYIRFCMDHGHLFNRIAALDVIGDPEASWENYQAMRDAGIDCIPTFHQGEDYEHLTRMLDECEYIALGGMVGAATGALREWLDHVWTTYLLDSDGKPIRKVHGFGLTNFELMHRYPWASVDSSSWQIKSSFGECAIPEETRFRTVGFTEGSRKSADHYDFLGLYQKAEIDEHLEFLGVTAEQCAESYLIRDVVNAHAYWTLDEDYEPPEPDLPQDLGELAALANRHHAKAEQAARKTVKHAWAAGNALIKAKKKCKHGKWLSWLAENCPDISERTAQLYMQLALKYVTVPDLSIRQAREQIIEHREKNHRPALWKAWSAADDDARQWLLLEPDVQRALLAIEPEFLSRLPN